ncbi:MAG: hypothetical protein Q9195_004678 [Heterodermia aff. obscurata]
MPAHTSNASTFITNLRLLDLDKQPDWPAITAQILTAKDALQNQKRRIQSVEWALYRLFEIWDPQEASMQKLQPFFPPLVPLQSLNLRAALFRSFNDLKKHGQLGREVIIRKTMLDECKGEKFEEALAAFSTIVLRKRMSAEKGGNLAIARRLALASDIKPSEQRSLLPLAIAHRASLTAVLHRKEQERSRYLQFQHRLDERDQQLRQQHNRLVQEKEARAGSIINEQSLEKIRQRFDTHWQGDPRWLDIILNGASEDTDDVLFETTFEEAWTDFTSGTLPSANTNYNQEGLLRNLENRVATQQARLQNWKQYREQIKGKFQTVINKTSPDKSPKSAQDWSIDLTAHKQIDAQQAEVLQQPIASILDSSLAMELPKDDEYAQLVKSMQRDLDAIGTPKRHPLRYTRGAILSEHHSTDDRRPNHSVCQSQLADDKLNEDEQPEQDDVNNSEEASLPDPEQLKQSKKSMTTAPFPAKVAKPKPSSDSPIINTPESCSGDSDYKSQQQAPSSRLTGTTLDAADQTLLENNEESMLAADIVAATINAGPSPVKFQPSLVERTRRSMAFASPELHHLPLKPIKQTKDQSHMPSEVSSKVTEDPRATLLERTRRSMSLLPAQPREPRKSMHKHRSSRQFPTNQFETPKKEPAILEDLEDMTPPEKLFSQEADYASVFKSRPKIAMSPTGSPAPDESFALDAFVDITGGNDDTGQWESSPLARIVDRAGP